MGRQQFIRKFNKATLNCINRFKTTAFMGLAEARAARVK
jgi:hypothetical protein